MLTSILAILALASLAVLAYYAYEHWFIPPPLPEAPPKQELPPIAGSATGWFNVLSGQDLLEHCKTASLLADIERQSRLSPDVFARDMLPALTAYAEFVQLTPASEAHHHSHIGGLIAHTFEVVLAALTFRNGYLLPLHATTEIIDAQRDHWSYAVFYAALLHDVGKVLTDLQIDVRDGPKSPTRRWLPLSGPITKSRAMEYEVRFAPKAERDYQAHQRLSLVMLQALVPANALAFLGREKIVLTALTKYLSGDEGITDDGAKALADIVKKADQQSVARNLSHGPRHRFATATAVPLNELLMQAIRHMLRDGTKLPLNRNGAAGWVYEGAVWFVAKRLADTVRKHIQEHYPDESIPGGNKNDRLFDTWQDYGLIEPNPKKGGAIWYVVVKGVDYELPAFPVLKFPLHRLFDDPLQYPVSMQGQLIVLSSSDAESVTATIDEADATTPTETVASVALSRSEDFDDLIPAAADAAKEEQSTVTAIPPNQGVKASQSSHQQQETSPVVIDKQSFKISAPKPQQPKHNNKTSRPQQAQTVITTTATRSNAASEPVQEPAPVMLMTESVSIPVVASAESNTPKQLKPRESNKVPETVSTPVNEARDDGLLPTEFDASTYEPRTSHGTKGQLQSKAAMVMLGAEPEPVFARVVPHSQPPKIASNSAKEPDPLAIEFIQWVQQGLASGSLSYNQADSMVHIVPEGIALVSPKIFREYGLLKGLSGQSDELLIQRKVIAAGWHMKAKHSNILHYQVVSEGKKKGKLSAVVLHSPTQWLSEVPPPNPYLKPFQLDSQTGNSGN